MSKKTPYYLQNPHAHFSNHPFFISGSAPGRGVSQIRLHTWLCKPAATTMSKRNSRTIHHLFFSKENLQNRYTKNILAALVTRGLAISSNMYMTIICTGISESTSCSKKGKEVALYPDDDMISEDEKK